MLTMAGRLEEAGKSQQLSGSRDVVAELCLALGMFIKLSLGCWLAPGGAHSESPSSCRQMCFLQGRTKAEWGFAFGLIFLPAPWQHLLEKKCFAAKRFTVKAFCTPGINSWQS